MALQINNRQVNIASIILAGGKGTRLFPLTLNHSKPAVSYGGRYKLIDIPISNSLNSNIKQIFVIGQYLTTELQHHLSKTYLFDSFFPGNIDLLTPEELPNGKKVWFEGTADAIRKNKKTIFKAPFDYFLILSGDQLYNINFFEMLKFAIDKDADLTIASLPVKKNEAKRLGVLKIDSKSYVKDFYEKPDSEELLKKYEIPKNSLKNKNKTHLGSMGIYIFKRKALEKLLNEEGDDFGKNLIPLQLKKGKTAAFIYNGYWEDIGTIKSYFEANLALTNHPTTGLQTYDENNPIYSRTNHLPGSKIKGSLLNSSLICEGGYIEAKKIENSVIGLRCFIKKNSVIDSCIIMGNSHFSKPKHQKLPEKFEIGENCLLKNCIIDEHVYIGNNVKLINKKKLSTFDSDKLYVRDGIIIIPSGTIIEDNFIF